MMGFEEMNGTCSWEVLGTWTWLQGLDSDPCVRAVYARRGLVSVDQWFRYSRTNDDGRVYGGWV
jgi:hypothetical protein